MNMSITLALILIAMAVEVRAVERGYTIVTATGGMFYDGGEWWQVAIAGMELALYSLAEDCETREQCQDQWQEDYWDAEGNFPIGNFQTEFGIAHFIAQNLNVKARVLIRPDDRKDPLRYMWAWGAELAYFFTTRHTGFRPFVGAGAYWSRGRLSAEQHWFCGGLSSAGRLAQTISGRSRQYRAGIDVVVTPDASLFIQVKYQHDELGEISPFVRDGLALGLGLSFTLD